MTTNPSPAASAPVQRLVGQIINSPEKCIVLNEVHEYAECYPVKLSIANQRIVINATNQGGHDGTEVDLIDLISWIKEHFPALLSEDKQS